MSHSVRVNESTDYKLVHKTMSNKVVSQRKVASSVSLPLAQAVIEGHRSNKI